jgi:hypothetical protein
VIRLIEAGKGKQSNPKKKEDKEVNFIVLELASGGELFDFIAMGGRFSEEVGRHYSN